MTTLNRKVLNSFLLYRNRIPGYLRLFSRSLLPVGVAFLIVLTTGSCQPLRPIGFARPYIAPVFTDDAGRASLIKAAEHQIDYLDRLQPASTIAIDGRPYSVSRLKNSLRLFLNIVRHNPSPAEMNRLLQENFTAYQAAGSQDAPWGEMLVTGYYLPVFAGSLVKKPPFVYPLYSRPKSLVVQRNSAGGSPLIGRRNRRGRIVPYWTRKEIEDYHLAAGNELVYLQDPVEVFFLQIQGSGLILLRDGNIRLIHVSATNGRQYRSIGRLLIDEHKVATDRLSMRTIWSYLHEHPADMRRILQYNKRYVFFRWEKGKARGSIGEALTAGRSIAIDPRSLPMGTLGYLVSRRPIVSASGEIIGWMPLRRFVFPQDTGAAIKGSGHIDLFWGSGLYAEAAAGGMKERGRLYFLVKKRP